MTSNFVQIAQKIFPKGVHITYQDEFEICARHFVPSNFIILRYYCDKLEYAHHLGWDGKTAFPSKEYVEEPAYSFHDFKQIKNPTEEQFINVANNILRQIKEIQYKIKLSKIREDF